MGCNTSNEVKKEVPEADTEAETNDNNTENVESSEPVDNNIQVENVEQNDAQLDEIEEFDKSTSAKTVTLKSTRPNSETSAASVKAELGSDTGGPETTVTIEHQNGDFLDVEEALAEELAAAKIQAAFRGHQTRKNMKQADNPVEAEPSKEQLEAEFRADDQELCHAATKIQASFRGHMARKTNEPEKPGEAGPNAVDDEIADIDLTDPDLSKAAVKIQASFRGHMARKDNDK